MWRSVCAAVALFVEGCIPWEAVGRLPLSKTLLVEIVLSRSKYETNGE